MSSENTRNDMEEKDLRYISASEFSQHLKILTQQNPLESKMIDSWIMPGPSIQEIVDQKCNSSDVSILLDSEIIPRSSWAFLHPLPGTVIQIVGVPKGGDEEGKSPLRIILTIAVMAAAAWVGGSAMALAWFGGSKVVAGLAGMAVAYLGMMAVNAIAPPPKPLDDSSDVKMSASLTGMRNTFNPYGPIPKILGTHRVYPQYASRPYTEILGDDQYLRLLFVVGYGPLDMTDYRIGETPLEDFDDVEMQVMHGYSDDVEQTIYTQTVEENQLSILLEQSGGWYLRTTEADIDEISIDVTIPAGLYTLNSEGRRVSRKVELEIQYAPTSTSDWTVGQSFELIGAQESPTMKSVFGAGPFYQPVSMYRVVLNNSTGALVLCGPTITTYLSSNYGPPIANSQFPPPVPGWASPIALITIPANATTITNAMIIDERTATAPDRENAGDFLPSQDSPLSMNIDVAAGNLRLQFVVEEARPELIRMTKSFQVTNGQYDVRMRRITADGGDDDVDEVYWTTLRSITHEHPIQLDEDLAIVALRIKASDQLNGIVDTFNVVASGIIPDWNGSAWVDRITNNPASLYREVLQCNANKQALTDSRLNLDAIQDWHEDNQGGEKDINNSGTAVDKGSGKVGIPVNSHGFKDGQIIYVAGTDNYDGTYEIDDTSSTNEIVIIATYTAETFSSSDKIRGQGFEFNLPVDFTMSIEDLLVAIAAAGRARPDYLDGQHTIVQDKPQTTPAQHIAPRNSWNFSGQKLFYQMPHAFRVKFKNEEKDYREDEIIVYDDGYNAGNATRFEMLDLPGITTRQLAWKHARFHIAVARLRPETYNVYMDAENLTCTPGDLIHVAHDVTMWGLGWGRVVSWTLDGGDATHVTLDDVMPMEIGNSYSIRFRDDDGTTSIHPVVLNVGEQTILEFVTSIDSAEIPVVGSLALFGETSSESIKGIVQSIEPGNDLTALIVFVDEAPAIHTSDTGNIPAFDSQITQPFDVLTSIGAPVIDAIRSNEGVMVKDPGGAIIPRIAISFTYESGKLFDQVSHTEVEYKISGGVDKWHTKVWPNFQTEIFLDENIVEGDDYDIRARYWVFDGRHGPWSSIETETVVGRSTPPGTPSSISATAGIDLIRLDWTTPPVIDFDHVRIWRNTSDTFPGGNPKWTVESAAGYPKSMIDEDVNYGTTYYYFFKSADSSGNLSVVSNSVNANTNKVGTGDISDVGGWTVTDNTLYDLTQGTPGSSEEDGIVIDSANQVITTWEDTAKRIMFGKLSAGVYGIRGYATNGTTVIFELSDAQQKIAGWNFTDEALYNLASGSPGSAENDGIVIDAANKWIRVFENTEKRIQLGYLGVAGIYGIIGYAANGTTKVFEISDTQIMLAGWNFTATTLASANITIDSGNNRIRSSNYVSGILGAGFTLEPDLLEIGNIRARGMIRTAVFQKDIVSVVGGNLVVLPGDVLNIDMTAADNSTLTIEGNETFAVNDILWIKDDTYEEWLQVTNIGSAPTYTVTRDKGSDYGVNANPAWKKGASVVHYGNTTSGGTVYMTASEADAPYIQVNTHVGAPWNAQIVRLRIGNLKGFLGEGSEVYGIAIGEATKYLKYDPTGGLQIKGTIIITGGSGIASLTDAGDLVTINEGDINVLNTTNAPAEAGADVTSANNSAGIDSYDVRNDNEPPSFYYAKGMGTYNEFKLRVTIGAPGSVTYGTLKTTVPWSDFTGGKVVQQFYAAVDSYKRHSASNSTWLPWTIIADGADVTGSNTSADTALVNGLAASRVSGWAHASDTTKIDGGNMYVGSEILIGGATQGAKFSLVNAAFGAAGIQLVRINDGGWKTKAYFGDGANEFFKYVDGSGVSISTAQANAITIKGGGDITLEADVANPGKLNFASTFSTEFGATSADGSLLYLRPLIADDNRIAYHMGSAINRFSQIWGYASNQLSLFAYESSTKYGNIFATAGATYGTIKLISAYPSYGSSLWLVSTNTETFIEISTPVFRPESTSTTALGESDLYYSGIYADVHNVDAQFYLSFSGNDPIVNFDTDDYILYDRSENQLSFIINSTVVLNLGISNGLVLSVGDDAEIRDVNLVNTFGVYGQASSTWGYIKTYITDPSSRAYKKNITSIDSIMHDKLLDELNQIELKLYHRIGEDEGTRHLGVIAEEVPDRLIAREREKDGGVSGIDAQDFASMALFGVKEALEQIDQLKSRIELLE